MFGYFPKFHMKNQICNVNANEGSENIFKPTIGNESLYHDSNDNGVRIVNLCNIKKSSCYEYDVPAPRHSYVRLDLS